MPEPYIIHAVRPEGAILETRGMLISVWRDLLNAGSLRAIRESVTAAYGRRAQRVTTLSLYELPRMAVTGMTDESTRKEIIATLRAVDQQVVASASVLDMGEFLAATLRSAIAGIQLVARPKVALKVFPTVSQALGWLLPLTFERGGPEAARHFLGAIDALRAQHDAFLATPSRPPAMDAGAFPRRP